MSKLVQELEQLAKSHPRLSEDKTETNIFKLGRIASYYEGEMGKVASNTKRFYLFKNFANTIHYAITIIRMHRALVRKVNEMYEEHKDD